MEPIQGATQTLLQLSELPKCNSAICPYPIICPPPSFSPLTICPQWQVLFHFLDEGSCLEAICCNQRTNPVVAFGALNKWNCPFHLASHCLSTSLSLVLCPSNCPDWGNLRRKDTGNAMTDLPDGMNRLLVLLCQIVWFPFSEDDLSPAMSWHGATNSRAELSSWPGQMEFCADPVEFLLCKSAFPYHAFGAFFHVRTHPLPWFHPI